MLGVAWHPPLLLHKPIMPKMPLIWQRHCVIPMKRCMGLNRNGTRKVSRRRALQFRPPSVHYAHHVIIISIKTKLLVVWYFSVAVSGDTSDVTLHRKTQAVVPTIVR